MSYSAPGTYNGWEIYAGQPFAVKTDDNATVLTGNVDASGCATLSIPLPDNYIGGVHWFVNGIKRKVATFDYRLDIPAQGAGPFAVVIDAGVPGARVRATKGFKKPGGETGEDGTITLAMDAGTWQVVATAEGYDGSVSEIEVDGPATFEVELTLQVLPPADDTDPLKVPVEFLARDFGKLVEGVEVIFIIETDHAVGIGDGFETSHRTTIVTGEDGKAVAYLYPSSLLETNGLDPARYRMKSKQVTYDRKKELDVLIEVPDIGGRARQLIVTN